MRYANLPQATLRQYKPRGGKIAGENTRAILFMAEIQKFPPIDIDSPEEIAQRIAEYFHLCAEYDMKPAVAGLALALGVSRSVMNAWRARSKKHQPVMMMAFTQLEFMWEQYMLNGSIHHVSGMFLGKNQFGYKDQVEIITGNPEQLPETQSPEQLLERYREQLPPSE